MVEFSHVDGALCCVDEWNESLYLSRRIRVDFVVPTEELSVYSYERAKQMRESKKSSEDGTEEGSAAAAYKKKKKKQSVEEES